MKMTRCAEMFLAGFTGEYEQCRFDAVIILPDKTAGTADAVETAGMNIEHIENIF
jgi:Holliday junction resolvase-like predicted endonuclease